MPLGDQRQETAVTRRRVQARTISELGLSEAAIEARLDDPDATDQVLGEVASRLRLLTEKHLSYPILHYFHSPDRSTALAPSLAALDEAVGALSGRPPADRPPMLSLMRFRGAVDDLLDVMENHLASHVPAEPPGRAPQVAFSWRGVGVPPRAWRTPTLAGRPGRRRRMVLGRRRDRDPLTGS